MNKSAEFQEDGPRVLSNAKARKETIKKVADELATLDAKIAELREEKNAIKNTKIKGDLGMKIADFNLALRLYRLEGEARGEAIDTLKECFEALAPGEQLDFIAAGAKNASLGGLPGNAPTH